MKKTKHRLAKAPIPPPPIGTSDPVPPCGWAETCTDPLETDQKTAFPFPNQISASDLAGLLGVTPRRITQLAEAGVLTRSGRGTYPFPESVTAFCQYQRRNVDDDSERRFREARASLLEVRQRKAQLEFDLLTGKSLRADIAKEIFCGFILAARSRLLALPSRCAPQVADLATPLECFQVLSGAVNEALEEIANASEETARRAVELHRAEQNIGPVPGQPPQAEAEDL